MKDFFSRSKSEILNYLQAYTSSDHSDFLRINFEAESYLNDLAEFSGRGKMIRGGLVFLSHFLYQDKPDNALAACGLSMELLQSALLIHDDIIDRDEMRRGYPSLYFQYGKEGKSNGFSDASHMGKSLGICLGDLAFFLAFELLGRELDAEKASSLHRLVNREMAYVSLAQMKDVKNSHNSEISELEDVLKLYRFKTGRYTFSLPLMTGALLADQKQNVLDFWAVWGEEMGILFQIKDDELGLYAEESELGKPLGSDILEGKQTPFYLLLMNRASESEKEFVRSFKGQFEISHNDIDLIRSLMEEYGIREDLSDYCNEMAVRLFDSLDKHECLDEGKKILKEFIEYNLHRKK